MSRATRTIGSWTQCARSLGVQSGRRCFATGNRLQASYGFIGLGRMGYPMAKNLRTKINTSDTLVINDVNDTATQKFVEEVGGNVTIAKTVREVAEQTENIITVLPEPSHVRTVYKQILEQNNLLTATPIKKERLFIDCSTIDPMTSADVAAQAHSSGQGRFVDAPMSGGVVGAAAGQLTFMLGAEEDIVARVTEILSLMGKRVVHLGPPTSGLKGKLANNYLLALNNIATCEAMNMGVKWGLDPAKLTDMINTATGKCWPSDANTPIPNVNPNTPSSRDYEGGFGTALMLKDLRLALQAAKESDVSPFLGEKARELYTAVAEDSKCGGQRDFSVVYRYLGGKE